MGGESSYGIEVSVFFKNNFKYDTYSKYNTMGAKPQTAAIYYNWRLPNNNQSSLFFDQKHLFNLYFYKNCLHQLEQLVQYHQIKRYYINGEKKVKKIQMYWYCLVGVNQKVLTFLIRCGLQTTSSSSSYYSSFYFQVLIQVCSL